MSIKINKAIYHILRNSSALTPKVDEDRLFPIKAPDWTNRHKCVRFPFIVYTRMIEPEYSKSSTEYDHDTVIIAIMSDSYIESLDIAQIVREELENLPSGEYSGIYIYQCRINEITEDEDHRVYIQEIEFNIKSKP